MKKQNKTKNKTASEAKKVANYQRTGIIAGVGLGLALCIQLGVMLFERHIESERMAKLQELAVQHADAGAKNVERYVQDVWKKLERYNSRPEIIPALKAPQAHTDERFAKEIKSYIDNVVAIRTFEKGAASRDDAAYPPVRFSELDMIRRAEAGKIVLPEAANIDGTWLLTFAQAVYTNPTANQSKAAQALAGTMLVTLNAEELKKRVIRDQLSLGRIKLTQKFNEQVSQEIFSVGNGDLGDQVSTKIIGTHWVVDFRPSVAMKAQAKSSMFSAYLLIAVVLLLVLALSTATGFALGRFMDKRKRTETLIANPNARTGERGASGGYSLRQAADILDVQITEENEDLLGLDEVSKNKAEPETPKSKSQAKAKAEEENNRVPNEIFRAYDIRGLAKNQITTELAQLIGCAIGSEALDAAQDSIVVARDARNSSPELTEYLMRGILSTGCNVINIGTVPTPLLYFATCTLDESQSGVMVTASHNPKEYNGFKVVINGKTREADDIKAIRRRILDNRFHSGTGAETKIDISQKYIDTIFSDVALAGDISLVIDAGNGVTGVVAPTLFDELGCQVTPLFCDFNGNFPNHDPDPSVEANLQALRDRVKETGADLGVAFDGDGDRLVVVTPSGRVIWPDQLLMLFAKDVLSRNPGADVVFDVKSTRHLASCIANNGGRPIMAKTGHAPMKNKMLETGALLGGEYSGHIFIKDRWFGFDDGMYAAARLIEIISLQGQSIDEVFAEFEQSPVTPEIRVAVDENKKFGFIDELKAQGGFEGGRVVDIDGLRVEYPFGWGLVRASNTSAHLTLRFEGDDDEALHKLKSIFVLELKKVDPAIRVEWTE